MRRGHKKLLTWIPVAAVAILLGACSMDVDSFAAPEKKVQLRTESKSFTTRTAALDDAALAGIVDNYRHYGAGTADIAVTYDPKSKTNTAMNAANEAARITGYLRRKGVTDIAVDVLPVHDSGSVSDTMISYKSVTAEAPEGCESMGGLDGQPTLANEEYGYGCTIQMQIARQIARPKDLQGREGVSSGDGRRQSVIVETYRSGVRNEALEGETASE
ncbi:MAG TPA: CpaD family pilus assembly lipoprotein [Alphaproteobacteria bacterium]